MSTTLYPAGFYADRRAHTAHAAARILEALPTGLSLSGVADIGCGTGTFLAAARTRGATRLFGIEGSWVTREMLDDPGIEFTPHDLEAGFTGPRLDLALCLEVAEHLSPGRAESFVSDLAALAPAVLFGAAIPGQGGVGHLNERWPSYWAGVFARLGYRAYDVVRPRIWSDDAIPAWYRQNIVLYLDDPTAAGLGLSPADPAGLDLVHPAFWNRANRELRYAGALPESEVLRRQAEQAQQQ